MKKTSLITGITGQDGSYLAELLLSKNYTVVGMVSQKYNIGWENIESIKNKLIIEDGDLLDKGSLEKIFAKHKPDEVYNLAGLSFIPACLEKPQLAFDINCLGVLRMLEIVKDKYPKTKFWQASSAKMFGSPQKNIQNEETEINPIDPYSISKASAHFLVKAFRRNFSTFAVSGIMYNHESIRRGPEFVTRKITMAAAKIKLGLEKKLALGNIKAKQDWGYAPDYVEAMWLMLQAKTPQDYILATGKLHTVEDICKIAFSFLDLDYKKYIVIDKSFYRKIEGNNFCGNNKKAKEKLHWKPKVSFEKMIKIMTESDYQKLLKMKGK